MEKLTNKSGQHKIGHKAMVWPPTAKALGLQALKESEARFRSIVLWSPDAIIVTDAKGKIKYMNPAAEGVFNRKLESFIGKDFGLPLVDGESTEIDIFRLGKEPGVGDMHVVEAEWLNKKAHLITIRDISERKKIAEALRGSEERYRIQFEQTIDALFLSDIRTGIILDCNKAAMELIGREKSEMVGQHQRILHPSGEWDGKFFKSFKQHITGEALAKTKIIKKSGEIRDVAIKASAFDLKGKKVILAIFRDITDSKKAEGALIEAVKVKLDFTSTVSHELRTPLAAIKEGIAIVLDGSAGILNAEQKDFLSLAKRNVDRLARLINDVLDFQKLEAHKMAFNIQENDINELIKEVYHTMAPLADKKSLVFALQLEEGLPRVKFDWDRIVQVLTNLVNNAIKFTAKGRIVIASRRGDNVIQVSVKDTGRGVKEEDMGRLFQQFSQLEKIIERKTGGTGLGLAISKEIIEKHKGRIWAESEFGKGATFWFILPVKAKSKVLVIDDDKAVLDIIKNSLEKEGYGVTCSENGLDAVEIIGGDKPDLIILDMILKDSSGYEIIGRLRSNKDTLRIPIIAISGHPEELIKIEDRQEELALVSIAKPFDLQDLLSIARKLLQQRF